MPSLNVTFNGDASKAVAAYEQVGSKAGQMAAKLVAAMTSAANVSTRAGTETYAALKKSESALADHVAALEKAGKWNMEYRDALSTVRRELESLEKAEIAAGNAAVEASRKRFLAAKTESGGQSYHNTSAIERQAQYDAMFKGQGHSYTDAASVERRAREDAYQKLFSGSGHSYTDAASVQASVERDRRRADATAAFGGPIALNEKQNAYLASKRAMGMGGGSGMAPGFAKLLATEATIGAATAGGTAATGFLGSFMDRMKGTGSGGVSQLVSVVSNTMSSLASGMSPARILAQQGPNFVQAFTLMSTNAFAAITKFLFNPLTWAITGAIAAVAGGAYLIYNYFEKLGAGLENIGNKYGLATPKAAELNDEFVKGRDAASQFNRELRNMGGELLSIAQKTDNLLKKMREKFALETEYAKARGASGGRLYEMELEELRKEQDVINRARELAYEKKAQNQQEAQDALDYMNSPLNASERVRGKTALSEAAFYAQVQDEMVKNNPYLAGIRGEVAKGNGNGTFTAREVIGSDMSGGEISIEVTKTYAEELAKLSNTIVDLDVEGRKFHGSLADAVREQNGYNALAAKLKQTQDELQAIYDRKTALTKADVESIKSLSKQESELITAINLKSDPKARALAQGGAVTQDLSANQRIGAFAMPMQTTLIDLNRQQLTQQTQFNVNLEKLLAKPDSGITPAMVSAIINGPFQ